MNNFLLDTEFLKELFSTRSRETYARVISLDNEENPREMIEGRVVQGSINLDGNSSMRRSCNLTMVTAPDIAYNDYYWALTTKFKLEIGLKNNVDTKYDNIVFFPMGVYVINNFNMSYGTGNYSISIQGQDKMCLLNGQVSGEIYSSVDFGTIEEIDEKGVKTLRDYEIEDIIKQAVHEYAKEPFHNIVIKDLPKYGLFLLNYTGTKDAYALLNENNHQVENLILNPNTLVYYLPEGKEGYDQYIQIPISDSRIKTFSVNELQQDKTPFTPIRLHESTELDPAPDYYVMKIQPGQAAGYRLTSLTYPRKPDDTNSGLVSGVGETLTSILDKIVSMLGDYEYFYNVEGQFVFQKKNKYIDTAWNGNEFDTTGLGNPYVLTASLPNSWQFDNGELITSYSNAPNLQNIKNDFSIWGVHTNSSGTELPIHLRYAVDKKPEIYTTVYTTQDEVNNFKAYYEYAENLQPQNSETFISEEYAKAHPMVGARIVDWREIIYRMALDYRKYNQWDSFHLKIMEANGPERYPGGITGYEQYYVDLEGFWRQLYDPDEKKAIKEYEIIEYENIDQSDPELLKHVFIKDEFETTTNSLTVNGWYNSYVSTYDPNKEVAIDVNYSDYSRGNVRAHYLGNITCAYATDRNVASLKWYITRTGAWQYHNPPHSNDGNYYSANGHYCQDVFVDTGCTDRFFYDKNGKELDISNLTLANIYPSNYLRNYQFARILPIADVTMEKLESMRQAKPSHSSA